MKHTTVRENTDGRNQAEWARNRRSDDYQLLCNDGRRADIDDWMDCNMGEIPANAIVTAGVYYVEGGLKGGWSGDERCILVDILYS